MGRFFGTVTNIVVTEKGMEEDIRSKLDEIPELKNYTKEISLWIEEEGIMITIIIWEESGIELTEEQWLETYDIELLEFKRAYESFLEEVVDNLLKEIKEKKS